MGSAPDPWLSRTILAVTIALATAMPVSVQARGGGGGGHVGAGFGARGGFGFHRGPGFHGRGPGTLSFFRNRAAVPPASSGIVPPFSGRAIVPPLIATPPVEARIVPQIWWRDGGIWRSDGSRRHGSDGLPFYGYGGFVPFVGEEPIAAPPYPGMVAVLGGWPQDGTMWQGDSGPVSPQVWHRDKDGNWHQVSGDSSE